MTTNGILLRDKLAELSSTGLTAVNISIDSLNSQVFAELTGLNELDAVLRSIHQASNMFGLLKLNVVVVDKNLDELTELLEFADSLNGKVICRFIELQENQPIFHQPSRIAYRRVPADTIYNKIKTFGSFFPTQEIVGKNPNCLYYNFTNSSMTFGVIANHSRGYPCGGCKKIRLSPYGDLGVCITAEGINIKGKTDRELDSVFDDLFVARANLDTIHPNRKHHSTDYGFWRWGDLINQADLRVIAIDKVE